MRDIKTTWFGLMFAGTLAACSASTVDDESMYLTGSEEQAVTLANGQPGCTNPKKELICHIPPGNPANAHSICVGKPAVEPHQTHHGDTIGACAGQPQPQPEGVDAGTEGGLDAGGEGGGAPI